MKLKSLFGFEFILNLHLKCILVHLASFIYEALFLELVVMGGASEGQMKPPQNINPQLY